MENDLAAEREEMRLRTTSRKSDPSEAEENRSAEKSRVFGEG